MGWQVIELNASDARNAGAIRKAATHASTHGSLFMTPGKNHHVPNSPDEVDHLSGGLREISSERIRPLFRVRMLMIPRLERRQWW